MTLPFVNLIYLYENLFVFITKNPLHTSAEDLIIPVLYQAPPSRCQTPLYIYSHQYKDLNIHTDLQQNHIH